MGFSLSYRIARGGWWRSPALIIMMVIGSLMAANQASTVAEAAGVGWTGGLSADEGVNAHDANAGETVAREAAVYTSNGDEGSLGEGPATVREAADGDGSVDKVVAAAQADEGSANDAMPESTLFVARGTLHRSGETGKVAAHGTVAPGVVSDGQRTTVADDRRRLTFGDTTAPRISTHRQLTPGQCPTTCYFTSCDYWVYTDGDTCAELESLHNCDCAGCDCDGACGNTNDGATDLDGDGCEVYSNSQYCGGYDDNDFSSNDMCCVCGAGSLATLCFDTTGGATDPYGDGCDDYAGTPSWCGLYDGVTFSSNEMCCACGGGSASASPTEAPTLTNEPSVSPASPTEAPTITEVPTATRPPDLLVTGSCAPLAFGDFHHDDGANDVYVPVGTTLDGRWFYRGQSEGLVLYFDAPCDGGNVPGKWIFTTSDTTISTTAE